MKSFLCELLFSCLAAAPVAKPVDELTYRTALYSYYQEDYQQALLDVMVADRQGRLGDDPLRFTLAKGSFAFKEGLYREAAETFAGVDPGELSELDRMRLSFHLARQDYRRGDWVAMESRLRAIDLGSNWRGRKRHHPELSFMRAEAALARQDFAGAEAALAELPAGDRYLAFGLFNLGVARRQAGDDDAARGAFERLSELKVDTEEAWDLVQRGRLALAMMARENGDAVDAQRMLGSLPGEGRYRDLALASYGQLAMSRQDHRLAGRIWLTMIGRDGWSDSRASAYLGLPMSLEALASPAHALDRYRQAERAFEARLAALETSARRAGDSEWVQGLLDAFATADSETRSRRLAGFDQVLGGDSWLQWLAREDVHRLMTEWRELHGMARWLERLPPRIEAFREITGERRRRSAAAGDALGRQALADRRRTLLATVAALEADLAALSEQPARFEVDWMVRLATPEERSLIAELSAMKRLAQAHMPEAERARVEPRLRRLLGVVYFQIANGKAARLRELDKRLQGNRALLAEVEQRMVRLAEAEARFAAGVETDFVVLNDRAETVARRVEAALSSRETLIARALIEGLEREAQRTREYLLTTRIAIARATDALAEAGGAEGRGAAAGSAASASPAAQGES